MVCCTNRPVSIKSMGENSRRREEIRDTDSLGAHTESHQAGNSTGRGECALPAERGQLLQARDRPPGVLQAYTP